MRTFGGALAPYLPAVPDGEVGERRSWVNRLGYQIFNGHLDLDTIRRPKPIDGVEQLLPRGRDDSWQFKVKPGIERVRFGNPGSRLGYARDAINSYFVFRTLREKGILPPGVRFQISIPMVNSVIRPLYFPDPADLPRIRPGFEAALAAEVAVIVAKIPHEDLAIQWDCAWELQAVCGAGKAVPSELEVKTHVPPIGRLSNIIPKDVALGFHFCFGTFGGWPAFAPDDLGRPVELINACDQAIDRPHRLDSYPDARSFRRRILRAAREARCQRRARLSRRDPHHGDVETARRRRAQISSGLWPRRLLRLRPHAAGADAAHPAGSPGRGENRWAGLMPMSASSWPDLFRPSTSLMPARPLRRGCPR